MYLPKNDGGNFETTPSGTFIARCYRFIDLGSHEQDYQGKKTMKRLVQIGFELPTELMADGRPFTISKRYSWSMNEKSTLRKDLEAWRGAKFSDNDFGPGGFDVRNLLGVACTLNVIHKDNGETVYANIASIGRAMKGVSVPEQINPSLYLSLEAGFYDHNAFDALHDKLKDFIRETPEFKALVRNPKSYADASGKDYDPARDPRYEGFDEGNPPPPSDPDDYGFPGDPGYVADRSGRRLHPVEA